MMDTRDCACGSTAVRDEAARWFVRLQEPVMDVLERQRFEAWLAEHPQHHYEFQVLEGMWSAAELLPAVRLQAMCDVPRAHSTRRPILRYAVAASVLAAAMGLGWFTLMDQPATYTGEFSTAPGERRQVALPDGSMIDLNSRSRIQVHFVQHRRAVELTEGEAMFSVEHDADRPFVVESGNGRVTVTGTRFDVRRDAGETRVVVEQGAVKVQGRDVVDSPSIDLGAGMGTRVDHQGKVAAAYAVNAAQLTAWRSGKLVFNDASLSEVAAQVSRYRERPLTVGSPAVGNLRLTSVFNTDNTEALLKALPSILPVAIRTRDDGSQEIIAR